MERYDATKLIGLSGIVVGAAIEYIEIRLGEKTSPATISRWENESQPIGGYAEKLFRVVVCEELKLRACAVDYSGSMITMMKAVDPWVSDPSYVVPPLEMELLRCKQASGIPKDTYDIRFAA